MTTAAQIINTLVNPITLDTYTPSWFTPLGRQNHGANSALFHAAALLATYGTAGYGTRFVQEAFKSKDADKQIEKAIKSSVEANTALMNPDPNISDVEGVKASDNPFIAKKASEKEAMWPFDGPTIPVSVLNASGYLIPALTAYTAYMYGNTTADKQLDDAEKARMEKDIKKLENIYQKANMERLLLAKGMTPDEIKAKTKELAYPAKPASAQAQAAKKTPGDMSDVMDKEAGWEDTLKRIVRLPSDEDRKAPGTFNAMMALAVLGLGSMGYGSYKVTKDFLANRDPAMRRARMIKKELERHFTTKKPTEIVSDFDPRLSDILNKGVDTSAKKKEAVVDTADESSLASMLNTQ